jgi:tripartite ATP-independent transporter DctM subunit
MGLVILLVSFFVLLVIGVPIAFSLAISSLVSMIYEGIPLWMVNQRMTDGVQIFSLLAIPFFIFTGEVMLQGKIAQRLVDFASAVVGWMRGGLGVVNVFTSKLFGGISGSAVADTSALGSILIPLMRKSGYDADYSVNVTVTSSIAGILIPPSHNMILYAVAAGGGISIIKLFLAGVIPGILMCCCLGIAAWLVAVRRGYRSERFPGV